MHPHKTPNSRGQMAIASETTLAFAGTNTYEKVTGTWGDGCANNFTVSDANDRITYTGDQTMCFIFGGASDCSVNKACITHFGLYKNGSLVPGAETPHGFTSPSKIGTVSINRIIQLVKGDYLEVWAKVDTAAVTITFNTLVITFFGEN
jgi:hypothetical protein